MDERIEKYLEKSISAAEKAQFEADLLSNPELAAALAFYVTAKDAAREEARKQKLKERHNDWQALRKPNRRFSELRKWYAIAAVVAMFAFGVTWYMIKSDRPDLEQLATAYTDENFTTLSLEMGGNTDSIQTAVNNYNRGQYATATKLCDAILARDPDNAEAKKVAGIVALRLLDYDKAITYFHQLGEQQNLYANPGKFYEAIALIKSGSPLNKKKAQELLQEVIDGNLEGKPEAMRWLD